MSEYIKDKCKIILGSLHIPPSMIIVPHVRLKGMKDILCADYKVAAKNLLETLYLLYKPKTVLVPSFTYTFTKSGVYHSLHSKSEVGRFSDEITRLYIHNRTPNPIFSFIDTGEYIRFNDIDHFTAFGRNSIFHFLDEEDCVILNIDLDIITQTQIHYIEKANNVPYRYDKVFDGVIYYNELKYKKVNYLYYVRDLSIDPKMNYKKREQNLIDRGALHLTHSDGLKLSWTTAKMLNKSITEAISKDPYYLINMGRASTNRG